MPGKESLTRQAESFGNKHRLTLLDAVSGSAENDIRLSHDVKPMLIIGGVRHTCSYLTLTKQYQLPTATFTKNSCVGHWKFISTSLPFWILCAIADTPHLTVGGTHQQRAIGSQSECRDPVVGDRVALNNHGSIGVDAQHLPRVGANPQDITAGVPAEASRSLGRQPEKSHQASNRWLPKTNMN